MTSTAAQLAATVRTEAEALLSLAARLEASPEAADRVLALLEDALKAGRRIITCGIGKSGLIARKLAATLRSTGSPAHFLHPAEALHGDLGVLGAGDPVLALSYSGETPELLALLPPLRRLGCPVVALTGCPESTLARAADLVLDTSVSAEACRHDLAPTASTTAMLALGDALAMELSRRAGFTAAHFADLHPGGHLGRRLLRVRDLMRTGDGIPAVPLEAPLPEVIHEMSRKRLGMTTVLTPEGTLAGIISDGDLRRLLEVAGPSALTLAAGQILHTDPHTIAPDAFASEALTEMERYKITSLVVIEGTDLAGIVHLHDVLQGLPSGSHESVRLA